MAEVAEIVCGGCGRKFTWKRELAGKSVRCKCGKVMRVSGAGAVAAEPAKAEEQHGGAYELTGVEGEGVTPAKEWPGAVAKPAVTRGAAGASGAKKGEWGPWKFIGAAVVLFGGAMYEWYDLSEFERSGGVRYMNSVNHLAYSMAGKWGPPTVGVLIALLCGTIGVAMLLGYDPDSWLKRKK